MVAFISPTVLFLVCSTAAVVHGQYGHFRPYPAMAMDHGFSPYHPARINHETLPISQAEFAQLVAESMATSNGPHHHHPPNTDADYEGPSHAMRDRAMLHGGRGGGHGGAHNHHSGHENQHQQHDDHSSHYQPEDNYRSHQEQSESDHEDDRYQRAPVYENSYHNDRDDEGDELDQQNTYGGRPGSVADGSGSDAPAYDNYDHPHHMHHQPGSNHQGGGGGGSHEEGEESRLRPIDQHYIPVANVPLSFV